MAAYYQTYRPKNFSEVIGQEALIKTLRNAAGAGKLAHAYLFTGGRGLGKTTVARIVAKAANCEKLKDGDPCGLCDTCVAIAAGTFLDCIEIDAASHTGVDNIRELIEHIQFQPSFGKTKVFIIDEVHMLSKAAFNALLKTLEEPPAHAMFILATTDSHKVPETIVSRTQRFDFRSMTPHDVTAVLERIIKSEKLKLPKGTVEIIVENVGGGMRDAQSQLATVALLPSDATLDDVHMLLGTTSKAVVDNLFTLIFDGNQAGLPEFFTLQTQNNFDAAAFGRKTLFVLQSMLESRLQGKATDSFAVTVPQLLHVIRLFLRAYKEIDKSIAPELPLLLASIEASMQFSTSPIPQPAVATIVTEPAVQQVSVEKKPEVLESEVVVKEVESAPIITGIGRDVTDAEVAVWWPQILEKIKKVNSPLSTLLKNSPVQEVIGNTVIVGVKYLFHKENLESAKSKALIVEIASAVAGTPIAFKAVIQKELREVPVMDTAAALTDAIKIFGGELVE